MLANLLAYPQTTIVVYIAAAALGLLVVVGALALRHSANRGLAQLVQADLHKGLSGSALIVLATARSGLLNG